MDNPNLMVLDLVDEAIDFADELNVGVRHLENEAAVLDFGVDESGGVEAGLLLAEVATGGLATVQTRVGTVDGAALAHVELSTDHPSTSLLACQAPAWPLDVDGTAVRSCGPAQLGREDGPDPDGLGFDDADFAVLVVESTRLPDEALVETVAAEAGVPTSGVFVLVAPASSVAGSVAFAARAGERTVARLATLEYDPADVRTVSAVAPVAPLAGGESATRLRSAGAIAYGGRAHLVVEEDLDRPSRLVYAGEGGNGHEDHGDEWIEPSEGEPESTDRLDDVLAPAQVTVDVVGDRTHVVGGVDEERLAERLDL